MAYKEFQEGDVIWGPDAYHADDPELQASVIRPWVVLSTKAYPRQGDEYLVCAITSNTSASDHLVAISDVDWEKRGMMKPGQVDPTTVVCMKHAWITRHTGRLGVRPIARARKLLQSFMAAAK